MRQLYTGVVTTVVAVAVLAPPGSVAAAQAAAESAESAEAPQAPADTKWEIPRTPDGRPDLQGVWLSNTATPLQRPPAFADRDRLTNEEVATLAARADRIFRNGRSAFTTPEGAFHAAVDNVDTYEAQSTSSSIGMVDLEFTDRTSLVVDPPDGRIPALTPAAQAREAEVDRGWDEKTGPEDLNNIHRCITTGVPRLGGNFGAGPYTFYQIVQTPDVFALVNEAFHDARLVPLDGRPHATERVRQWNGDSRGRWEGDTLVIETSNFSPGSYYRGSAAGLHLVERLTRTGPDTITYRMTFTDPDTWAAPWTAEIPLKRRDQPIYEFACHEGNYSIVGMLRTARLADAAPEAGR
ncbi:MAG: hypothetical protein OXH75_18480 [Acidobacteria bacterium]|nr:hypothetical protein [Acidobacteriota bacterium]